MTTPLEGQQTFSGMRLYFWPIHRFELKKLLPLLILFFFVSFGYNVLRTMKDAIVLYAPDSGAEAIPFLKVWAMFPATLLMTMLFTRLSNRFSREKVTYMMLSAFLAYFFLFVFVIHPFREYLEPKATAAYLQSIAPHCCKWLILIFRNWTSTSFYVAAEMWSNIVFFVLFWGFANQITRLHEAKRFYGILGVAANFSGVFAGEISAYLSHLKYNPAIPYGSTQWEQTMLFLVCTVLMAGLVILGIFRWMQLHVLTDPIYYDPDEAKADGRVQGKLSMREAFKYLFRSKYLIFLALIVISYNTVINLTEVIWKFEVKELYTNQSDYSAYMNHVASIISCIATFSALVVSGNAIRKCGWTFTAMLTPAILMVTSIAFFFFFFLKESIPSNGIMLGFSPLAMIVFAGTSQNIAARAAKYSVFDATKEMAFVPLSPECKLNGKAAIDGVCSRLGKTGGSIIHQVLLASVATFANSAPYVAAIIFVMIAIWLASARVVGRHFATLIATPPKQTDQSEQKAIPTQEELLEQIAIA